MIGSGNFGGKRMSDDPVVKKITKAPSREPDAVIAEKTSIDQVFNGFLIILINFLYHLTQGRDISIMW